MNPVRLELENWEEIARGKIEAHLGDVATEYESEEAAADAIYDEAFTLAYDALIDAECPEDIASYVARSMAHSYAQP